MFAICFVWDKYLTYFVSRVLTVEVDDDLTGEEPDWMKLIETRVDIPRKAYLGLSAMTGQEYSDHHDLSSFVFIE